MMHSVAESTKCGPRSADFLLHIGFSCIVHKILHAHYQLQIPLVLLSNILQEIKILKCGTNMIMLGKQTSADLDLVF